ncbi:MAG: flagellar hook-length control protein FliK [Bdellovibrionales bacterium]|nr:flagellar hook-length control protein FliK [Bdellovibrionales bacterium]
MDVLSTVANLNTPIQPKSTNSAVNGMNSQSSEKGSQNKEFSQYLNNSSTSEKKYSNKEAKNTYTAQNNENTNYNVKSKDQNQQNTQQTSKKQQQDETVVDNAAVTPNSQMTDDSQAVKTLSEHLNKIENSKQEFVDPLTKRAAIQNFVNNMKESFDIEPTEIVRSFANLSVEELGLPPEQTMGKVLSHLPLNNGDKQKAQALFTDMLEKTEASSMADYLKTSDREISLKAISDEQIKRQELDKSLVKLNENFFTPLKNPEKIDESVVQSEWLKPQQTLDSKESVPQWMNSADKDLTGQFESPKSIQDLVGLNKENKSFYSQSVEGEKPELSNYSVNDQQSLEEISKNVDSVDQDLNFKKPEPQVLDINKLALDRQMQAKQVSAKTDTSSDMESFSHDNLDAQVDVSKGFNTGAQAQKIQDTQVFQNIIQQQNVTEADVESNINKIIQSSQTMIKDGGGEMKIQMNPEGLGEVNLKVLVEDGNVNIEMIADNKDAKKLMEKGLLDLKANLASHKLNVDGIKIDMADQLQNQMQEEFQNQEREFARQFMQDFRQNNQGFRQQFFTGFGENNFKSQTEDEADNEHIRNQSNNKKSNSNRRLDLVA